MDTHDYIFILSKNYTNNAETQALFKNAGYDCIFFNSFENFNDEYLKYRPHIILISDDAEFKSISSILYEKHPELFTVYFYRKDNIHQFLFSQKVQLLLPIPESIEELSLQIIQITILAKKYQKEMSYKNDILSNVFSSSPIAISFGFPNGTLYHANPQFSLLTGYSYEELQKLKWNEHLTSQKWFDFESNMLEKLTQNNDVIRYEKEYIHKDGHIIPVEIVVKARFNEQGDIDHFIGFVNDITERKIAEDKLIRLNKELEQGIELQTKELSNLSYRLGLATRNAKIGVWEWDIQTNDLLWDNIMFQIFGMDPQNATGTFSDWEKCVHPEDLELINSKTEKILRSNKNIDFEYRIIWPDNSIHYVKEYAYIQKDNFGKPIKMIGLNWDISKNKELQKQLDEEKTRLQQILDNSPVAVAISTNAKLQYTNKIYQDLFGKYTGETTFDIYYDKDKRNEIIKLLNETGEVRNFQLKANGKNGEILDLLIHFFNTEFNGEKSIIGWLVDISELKKIEKELSDAKNQLEKKVLEQVEEISNSQMTTILALANLAESRDNDTGQHIKRVQIFCKILAEELGKKEKYKGIITEKFIHYLYHASPLHDIGKVGISDDILLKPGSLNDEEYLIMKTHTTIGAETLIKVSEQYPKNDFLKIGIDLTLYHHENWDGSGYPKGLRGEEIPISARILSVADAYDTLRNRRIYKEPISHEETCEKIIKNKGKQFDPDVIEAFEKLANQFNELQNKNKK